MQNNVFPGAPTAPTADEAASGPSDAFTSLLTAGGESSPEAPVPAQATKRRRRWPLWGALGALILVIAAGVGGFAYASAYEGRAVPGTTVGGVDVSGMTSAEIVAMLTEQASDLTVSIDGDATATASLADLGVTIDAQATADAALEPSATVTSRITGLLSDHDIDVVLSTDESATQQYAASLIPADQAVATNASLTLSEDGQTFTLVSATQGISLDSQALLEAASSAASTLSDASVTVSYTVSEPAVSDSEAQAVVDEANSWVAQSVTIATADGAQSFTADAATKASWITVSESVDAAPTLTVDAAKVTEWVNTQVAQVAKEAVTGQRTVTSSGTVVNTTVTAVDGVSVTNAEELVSAITSAFSADAAYSGTISTQTVTATWTDKVIATGAENLVYQAAEGEKWIDVNLSTKTVTSYEGATVVRGPISIVDGAAETPTVTGTFTTYLQYTTQTMRGTNADGTPYETEDVPWVTYFYGGYAFHGAPWRSSFGYSGSHGCINMPVAEAQWIYNWAGIGTTVVVHY